MIPALPPLPDPLARLDDVRDLLKTGGRNPAGLHLDPDLCRALALGLADVREGVALLIDLAAEVQASLRPPPARRSAAARAALARLAAPLDPEGRILAFPGILTGDPA